MDKPTLDYYALHASEVAQRYEVAPSPLAHRFAESFSSGGRILDIGCGSGRDLAQLHKQGFQPYGVDGTEEFVQLAQMLHPENHMIFALSLEGFRYLFSVLPATMVPAGLSQ